MSGDNITCGPDFCLAFNKVSIFVVFAMEGRPPMVDPVGLTIVLEVATEVGGAGALIADVDGIAMDPVVTGAVVVDDIAPGGAVVPGGPTGPVRA